MKLRILNEAADEFADAITRYELIESGLGVRLKQEVRATRLLGSRIMLYCLAFQL